MKNVVIEIDGVRHKLVEDKRVACKSCSLKDACENARSLICLGFEDYEQIIHFELEK